MVTLVPCIHLKENRPADRKSQRLPACSLSHQAHVPSVGLLWYSISCMSSFGFLNRLFVWGPTSEGNYLPAPGSEQFLFHLHLFLKGVPSECSEAVCSEQRGAEWPDAL